MASWIELVEAS